MKKIAQEWQRMFPTKSKYFPITEIKDDTAYAEIRVKCPVRDSGNVKACYKLMEYDRQITKRIGVEFKLVLVDSRA